MRTMKILVCAVMAASAVSFCRADAAGEVAKENAELKKRVEKLERELAELKKIVMQQGRGVKTAEPVKAEPAPRATGELAEADYQKILAIVEKNPSKKKPVWSNLDIQLYGYIKADASYDSSRTTTGNFVVWADNESSNNNDNEFNMTANQTRLGMLITGPQEDDIKTSGRVEIDFYGSGADENKAKIQMRHAYLKLDWPENRLSIIAGQTSDVISPLNPYTLNYTVLWDVGNIGYRHPQIRLTKAFAATKDIDMKIEGALSRTIGDTELLGLKAGEDSGFPTFQGRLSATFPFSGHKPTTIGFSGHWAEEEYDSKDTDSWSINLDVTQPINKWLTIKGELFNGENLDNYFGGIGQGVDASTLREIGSRGGWIAANLGPWGKWNYNIGAGIDDVDDDDVTSGARTLNRCLFGNAIYSLTKNAQIGFELSHWRTEYKGSGDAEDFRAQTSFIYKF